jgi:hypothetical protein
VGLRHLIHHGVVLHASTELDDAVQAAIQEVSEGPYGCKVKLFNKLDAQQDVLAKLFQHLEVEALEQKVEQLKGMLSAESALHGGE